MSQEMLSAAILSAALVIGLLVGLPLGHMAHNFHTSPSTDITLPQKK